jgi:hypothetical protein
VSRKTIVKIEVAFLLAIPLWAGVLTCLGPGPDPFSTVYLLAYFHLVIGWLSFLVRVIPNVTIDWFSTALAGGCLLGLVGGMHFFGAWLHREIQSKRAHHETTFAEAPLPPSTWKFRTTLSVLGIFVLMFVAGTAAVGSLHQLIWLRTRSESR